VHIIAGDNAGKIIKISSIASGSPNTYTIDTAVSSSTNAARARYLDFKDLGTAQTQNVDNFHADISKSASWIQFLFILQGDETSPELEDVIIDVTEEQL
jgi:hypothetical protein